MGFEKSARTSPATMREPAKPILSSIFLSMSVLDMNCLECRTLMTLNVRKENLYLREPEMAEAISVSPRTLRHWRATRTIPFVKVRRLILYEPIKVRAALQRFERQPR